MPFIKIGHLVINTKYIVAIKLGSQTSSGEMVASILLATPSLVQSQAETASLNYYDYEWLNFTAEEAQAIHNYFSNINE